MNFKSTDLENFWPKLEPLCCVSLTYSNPKGGAHVTQDSITNQNLHMDLPVRKGGSSSWFQASNFLPVIHLIIAFLWNVF